MCKNSKISLYKIKKILKFFVDDYSALETSRQIKLHRNTVNRYYNRYRKIIRLILVELFLQCSSDIEYLGYIRGEFGPKKYIDIYQYSNNLVFFNILDEQPKHKKYANRHKDSTKFRNYFYKRCAKFHGFVNEESYTNQLIECAIRYYYGPDELYKEIYKRIHLPLEKIY